MVEKNNRDKKAKILAEVAPLLDDGNGRLNEALLAAFLDIPDAEIEARSDAAMEKVKNHPRGLTFRRRSDDNGLELVIDLGTGLSALEKVFPRNLSPDSMRYETGSSCPEIEEAAMDLPYCPIQGQSTPTGDVMLMLEARGLDTPPAPKVRFLGGAPDNLSITQSPRGATYTVVHFTCDPGSEMIFDCPDRSTVQIELRGSLFSD